MPLTSLALVYRQSLKRVVAAIKLARHYLRQILPILIHFLRLRSGDFEGRKFSLWESCIECFYEFAPLEFDEAQEN